MRYAVVIERAEHNYSAYVPDVDGCVATGDTVEEVTAQIAEALAFHFTGMAEDGDPIPLPPRSSPPSMSKSRSARSSARRRRTRPPINPARSARGRERVGTAPAPPCTHNAASLYFTSW